MAPRYYEMALGATFLSFGKKTMLEFIEYAYANSISMLMTN